MRKLDRIALLNLIQDRFISWEIWKKTTFADFEEMLEETPLIFAF